MTIYWKTKHCQTKKQNRQLKQKGQSTKQQNVLNFLSNLYNQHQLHKSLFKFEHQNLIRSSVRFEQRKRNAKNKILMQILNFSKYSSLAKSMSKRTSFFLASQIWKSYLGSFVQRYTIRVCINTKLHTRKCATCRWPLSDASRKGVNPALSFTVNSCFVPACTSTVQASTFPPMAAQCNGVQPNNIKHQTSLQQKCRKHN